MTPDPTDPAELHLAHLTSIQVTNSDIDAMKEALEADLCGDLGRINAVTIALGRYLTATGEIRVVMTSSSSVAIIDDFRLDLGPKVKRWLDSAYEGDPVLPIAIDISHQSARSGNPTPRESESPSSTSSGDPEACSETQGDDGVAIQV